MCLSLLNTASSGGEAVKWNPEHSNLKQVLLSIQSMIFVSDPMYNMPGLNRAKGTKVRPWLRYPAPHSPGSL